MAKKTPKVSVVMITYNHAAYIEQALGSVLRQKTDFFFEILLGDDGSTDETANIIEQYAEKFPQRITAVIRPENVGATRNFYDLITRAKGDYIAYLEGDDYWTDCTKLQQQVDFLESHPQYIGCTHKITLVDNDGTPCHEPIPWICDKEVYTLEDFGGIVLPGHVNSLVHRNFFRDEPGKYEDLITMHPMIGDRPLCLLVASKSPIYQIQSVMGCYRKPASDRLSATNVLYEANPEKTWDDYVYTKKLETYAAERLHTDASFEPQKKHLLLDAVCTALRRPGKGSGRVVWRIIKTEKRIGFAFSVFGMLIKKIVTIPFKKIIR